MSKSESHRVRFTFHIFILVLRFRRYVTLVAEVLEPELHILVIGRWRSTGCKKRTPDSVTLKSNLGKSKSGAGPPCEPEPLGIRSTAWVSEFNRTESLDESLSLITTKLMASGRGSEKRVHSFRALHKSVKAHGIPPTGSRC